MFGKGAAEKKEQVRNEALSEAFLDELEYSEKKKDLLVKLEQKEKQEEGGYWKPEPGEVLIGKVADIAVNGDAQFAEIETDDGRTSVFLNFSLTRGFEEEKVETGDVVAIKYQGLFKSKSTQRQFKKYVVCKG